MKGLVELRYEAECAGIITKDRQLWGITKDHLMKLLAEHFHPIETGHAPMLSQLPVMLARNVKDLKEEALDALVLDENYIAEEKLNEVRAKLHLGAEGNRIDSRHRAAVTYEYVEKTNQMPHLRDFKHSLAGTVLDGGLQSPVEKINFGKTQTTGVLTSTIAIVNSSPERAIELQEHVGYCNYYAWDVLFYCGKDIRSVPYHLRHDILLWLWDQHLVHCLLHPFRIPEWSKVDESSSEFYKRVVAAGGEGIMLKHLDYPYEGNKRSKGMYKWKKHADMDCFVTGYVPGENEFCGLVGSLKVSIMDANENAVEVAAIQPGSLTFRNEISLGDGSLRDDIYGKVVEVTYFCKTKNKRLQHAVIGEHGWRTDKTMYDCTGD